MEFQKISSPSLKDLFINQLEQLILSGKLKIGEKLPPERQLAQSMQVSRAVVNGGIAELEKRGFLEVKPRSGTYVTDYRKKGTIDTLISIMNYNGGHLRNEEIKSILEVRESLDTLAARLCIKRLTDEDVEVLHQLAQKIRRSGSVHEAAEAAFAFEHEFALLSGNVLIPLIYQSFRVSVLSLWEHFCVLHGISTLYDNIYHLWTYLRDRDTEGACEWIHTFLGRSIQGDREIYFK